MNRPSVSAGATLKGTVKRRIRRSNVKLGVEDNERLANRRHDIFGIRSRLVDEALTLPAFADIPKDEDHAHDVTLLILDRGRTVVDGSLAAITGDQKRMIAQPPRSARARSQSAPAVQPVCRSFH